MLITIIALVLPSDLRLRISTVFSVEICIWAESICMHNLCKNMHVVIYGLYSDFETVQISYLCSINVSEGTIDFYTSAAVCAYMHP